MMTACDLSAIAKPWEIQSKVAPPPAAAHTPVRALQGAGLHPQTRLGAAIPSAVSDRLSLKTRRGRLQDVSSLSSSTFRFVCPVHAHVGSRCRDDRPSSAAASTFSHSCSSPLLQVALSVAAEFWEQGDLERTVLEQQPIVSTCERRHHRSFRKVEATVSDVFPCSP